jgi:hypothetical protein
MILRSKARVLYNPIIVDSRISVRKTNTTIHKTLQRTPGTEEAPANV